MRWTSQQPDGCGRRSCGLAAALLLAASAGGGCASSAERGAFDQWTQREREIYGQREGPRPASEGDPWEGRLPDEETGRPSSLEELLQEARVRSPAMRGAFDRWKAALERLPQARSLPDPQITYAVYLRQIEDRQKVGLSQAFPWFGKLLGRRDIALEEARGAAQRFEAERLDVEFQVRYAWAEYIYVEQAIVVLREQRRLLEEFERAAQVRFEAAEVPYADVVRAQVELDRIDDDLQTWIDRRQPAGAKVNAAAGRPPDAPLPDPRLLEEPAPLAAPEDLLADMRMRNPELLALGHQVAARRHGMRVARQEPIPDFLLGIEYMDSIAHSDDVAAMVGLTLPIQVERYGALRRESLAQWQAAVYEREHRLRNLEADLVDAHFQYRDALRKVDLFHGRLIPRAREAVQAVQAAYASGETDFLSVIEAQTVLQEFLLTYERALVDRVQSSAQLQKLAGGEVLAPSGDQEEQL